MFTAGDTETSHIPIVVEYIEPFRTRRRREAGDYIDVSGASYGHYEVFGDGTALDEVFVSLRFIEAADYGPNDIARRSDELREKGGALAWAKFVGVELEDELLQVVELVLR